MKLILFILVLIVSIHSLRNQIKLEWQTGLDLTIHNQTELERPSNYPVHMTTQITFQRNFSKVPEVLLMFEQLTFQNQKDVDIAFFVGEVTQEGFELRYRLGGPSTVSSLKVRWIAIIDPSVKILNLEYGFMDMKNMRQGQGERSDSFEFKFEEEYERVPRVQAFITGFRINPEEEDYSLRVEAKDISKKGFTLFAETLGQSKLRFMKVSVFLSLDSNIIMEHDGVDANEFNFFEDQTKTGIRKQEYKLKIGGEYFVQPENNIIAQGITGFEVIAKKGQTFNIGVDHYLIKENSYSLSYGPNGDSIVNRMDVSVILHEPTITMVAGQKSKNEFLETKNFRGIMKNN